ncbi:BlaI/MecI/CopY family transcriptional regulator [Anaerovorax odorimutans]|uniref:BlaI/MecI/CopY family transcriptional regulator n=1 Tax=Anaerovorax odorimutans TaxID=109327 RepID=UPI00042628CF|nr:BlaI/MecI/CopY family transcriptional regulator [Anaerovorax odorimutans]
MKMPKISESEWEIMKIVWEKHPVTSEEIIKSLSNKKDWTAKTVKSFLNRLLKKEVIGFEKSGRNYLYYPLFSEEECISFESETFLNRVYGGAIELLFSHYLKHEVLSDKELENLEKILHERKRKD